jgi:alkylation response protein AidB-like acyl-CoA dehydrogenase
VGGDLEAALGINYQGSGDISCIDASKEGVSPSCRRENRDLPPIFQDELRMGMAITEPNAGSDLASIFSFRQFGL